MSQPLPDERPRLVPPTRLPPVLRGLVPPTGGGGYGSVGRRLPWRFYVLVALLLTVGVSSLAFILWLLPKRPVTFAAALIGVGIQLYRRRHQLRSPDFDLFPGNIYIGAIGGGVIGELLSQLLFHVDPGAPTGALWLLAGAVGIGGGCGVAFAAFVTGALAGLVGSWIIWRNH